jgi:arginyl-tRNA synthetase
MDLARKLLLFPSALQQALSDLRPHFLGSYLYELAGQFSTFYNANRVLVENPDIRHRRLMFCHRTLVVMEAGLKLLGLRTLERM